MTSTVTFTCWENDDPTEVLLMPEEAIFKVEAGKEITFSAVSDPDRPCEWVMRVDYENKRIELFPEGEMSNFQVFENKILLEGWDEHIK